MSLNPCVQDGLIFKLPDEILLFIFKNLTTAELVVTAGVCRWFRRIAYEEEFWTTVDLTSKSYSNPELLRFIRLFPRDCTEVLKISGTLSDSGKLPPFTEQINSGIRISYPNLRYLHLSQYNFCTNQRTIKNITSFPSNLRGLYLTKCDMKPFSICGELCFLRIPKKKIFSFDQLEILSFENSPCIHSTTIHYLPDLCPTLVELNLNGCFKIKQEHELLDTLNTYSNTLRRLYLSRTRINDRTVRFICQKLKHLNILNIKRCKRVTQNIVENLLTLKQLEKLIANDDILILYNQRKNQQ